MTKELYIFSGLGADERVFQRLDFPGFSTTFIKWIVPQDKETIENYATRLLDQITTTNPTLIGLSFGGLIAVEVAKQIDLFQAQPPQIKERIECLIEKQIIKRNEGDRNCYDYVA